MTDQDEKAEKPETQEGVEIHYIKSRNFRVIHVDGAIGSITPRGYVHATIFSERAAIPRKGFRGLADDGKSLSPEVYTEGRKGIVRELEVDLMLDPNSVRQIRDWLDRRLEDLEAALQPAAGVPSAENKEDKK